MSNIQDNKKGFSGIIVLLLVVLLFAVGVVLFTNSGIFNNFSIPKNNGKVVPSPKPIESVRIDFPYTVKSVNSENIVLNGKNGDLYLAVKSTGLVIYKGSTKESPLGSLSDLVAGAKVDLEFVPGKFTILYLMSL